MSVPLVTGPRLDVAHVGARGGHRRVSTARGEALRKASRRAKGQCPAAGSLCAAIPGRSRGRSLLQTPPPDSSVLPWFLLVFLDCLFVSFPLFSRNIRNGRCF